MKSWDKIRTWETKLLLRFCQEVTMLAWCRVSVKWREIDWFKIHLGWRKEGTGNWLGAEKKEGRRERKDDSRLLLWKSGWVDGGTIQWHRQYRSSSMFREDYICCILNTLRFQCLCGIQVEISRGHFVDLEFKRMIPLQILNVNIETKAIKKAVRDKARRYRKPNMISIIKKLISSILQNDDLKEEWKICLYTLEFWTHR